MTERPIHHEISTPEQSKQALTPEEKLGEAVALLEAGYDRITTSEQFQDYLKTAALFHTYSDKNIMMIHMQKPDATQIAGFNTWKKMGRYVQKGETGIRIFAPMLTKFREEDQNGKERVVEILRGFRLVSVFDVSQTDGKDLPHPPMPQDLIESSERGSWLFGEVSRWVTAQGATVEFEDLKSQNPNLHGYFRPNDNRIAVDRSMSGDQQAKTLVHEAAHLLTVNKEIPFKEREFGETVAEGTAFVVLNHFGIDTSDYSFAYIANWSENRDMMKAATNLIVSTSNAIIEGIEPRQRPRGTEPPYGTN